MFNKNIIFTKSEKHLVRISNVNFIKIIDEFTLKARKVNRWEIDMYFVGMCSTKKYVIDYSPGLFEKYTVFVNAVRKALNIDSVNFYDLIDKYFYIQVNETYTLNTEKKTYEVSCKITDMEYVEKP